MQNLNLQTNNKEQELIKQYLEENASDILADKINNGVQIQKDNTTLINKKTLDGFMKYASDEAKKQAEKGASYACVQDNIVFGWAIHYFEEASIEEKLFNLDGSEYKAKNIVATKKENTTTTTQNNIQKPIVTSKKVNENQQSLFDLIEEQLAPKEEPIQEVKQEQKPLSSQQKLYEEYSRLQQKYSDSIVAYKVGDFYEVFGDNAVLLANELDLTLTSRSFDSDKRIPMVGFPFHCADIYFDKIIYKNHKLAIVDMLTTPSIVSKSPTIENIDLDTGEILEKDNNIDDEIIARLQRLLDNNLEVIL